ncbi:YceH family protein [Xanthomonas vasicola]|uniref:DUF480 domain-containing protein n=1 Tax=Xanthomonas vasicola TaxID=56459 RepID=A0ABD7S8C3_XANVA|nr:DUF480 domain-containing protein [Xanthomonas vasicola]AZR24595.1 DUF480 domain-containing protein [Xanthomonas vasicola]KGR47199.1 hypothetical protein NX04_01400 [Xanthomonas vasicola]KGR48388.1 hypothetical protein NX05_00045 [Xanthomonas vasicola]KGR61913.1 hypothetical protein NX79_03930 [Xanthomonas vasicola]MDO6985772.1 DUF480 domain-containing protein [Xanthomonas vasicola]
MTETSSPPVLDTAQARVLGCLIEKEATTPDAYPLTVNAAQVAANQKTAREPVLNLQTGVVHHALRQLETLGLVRQQFSSRAERYEHRLGSVLDLTRQQVALIGLLLLRGPQTLGELYARSERLASFADTDDVRHHLDRLIQRGLAAQLPRANGQREDRYAHLLSGELDVEALQAAAARAAPSVRGGSDTSELEARVQTLEATVTELQEVLAALQARLDAAGA